MENSYGIQEARARLGEIADHVRLSGEIVALTRHGRVLAAVGPVHSTRPVSKVEVQLHFSDGRVRAAYLPEVPRVGESFRDFHHDDGGDFWLVTEVQWDLLPSGASEVNVLLGPM